MSCFGSIIHKIKTNKYCEIQRYSIAGIKQHEFFFMLLYPMLKKTEKLIKKILTINKKLIC